MGARSARATTSTRKMISHGASEENVARWKTGCDQANSALEHGPVKPGGRDHYNKIGISLSPIGKEIGGAKDVRLSTPEVLYFLWRFVTARTKITMRVMDAATVLKQLLVMPGSGAKGGELTILQP